MNDATVKFGYDGAALNAGLADAEKRVRRTSGTMEQSVRQVGKAGAGFRGLGMASMQIQDIAVQLQSGTKASIIFAQQGSQLLSAFGPGGAILGGVIAVGGALYLAKQKSDEAFKAMQKESADFDKNLRILSAGGITEMINGMETMKQRATELRKEVAEDSAGGVLSGLKRFFSSSQFDAATGKWTNDREAKSAKAAELAKKNEAGRLKLIDQIAQASEDELKIIQLKAEGRDAEAQALEHQVKLQRELARLESAPDEIRAQLKKNAIASAAAEASIAEKKNISSKADLEKKRESIKLAQIEVQMLELQAAGQDRKLKKMQEQLFIERRAHELNALGLDARASIELAKRENEARQRIENHKSGGGSHIGGVRRKRYMTSNGIDEFNALQLDREYGINDRTPEGVKGGYRGDDGHFYGGYGREFGSLADRRPRTGRMMGRGDQGPLAGRRHNSAGTVEVAQRNLPPAAPKGSPEAIAQKLDETNRILKEGFAQ